MRKPIFLLLSALLTSSGLFGQNIVFSENFSSASKTTAPSGWTNRTLSGDSTLDKFHFNDNIYRFFEPLRKGVVSFDAYNAAGAVNGGTATNRRSENVALESPLFSVKGLSNAKLQFTQQSLLNRFTDIRVEVSEDSGQKWDSLWFRTGTKYDFQPEIVTLDLSSYTSSDSIQIRFRWQTNSANNYSGFFCFNNVLVYETLGVDVAPFELVSPSPGSCGTFKSVLKARFKNTGSNTIFSTPVMVKVGNFISRDTITAFGVGTIQEVEFPDSIDLTAGGSVNVQVISNLSGDLFKQNDTMIVSIDVLKLPRDIEMSGDSLCGAGRAALKSNAGSEESSKWYSDQTQKNLIAIGAKIETPKVQSSATFYGQNFSAHDKRYDTDLWFNSVRTGGRTTGPGSMFSITANHDMMIDSFSQSFIKSGTYAMQVYYKKGSYVGSETNQSEWTLLKLKQDTVLSNGYADPKTIMLTETVEILKGETYSFYIKCDVESITYSNRTLSQENSDFEILSGVVLRDHFANPYRNAHWNGSIFYRTTCSSPIDSIRVHLTPQPRYSLLAKGAVFEGIFSLGTSLRPDIGATGLEMRYEVVPPDSLSNADYGTNWKVSDVSITTIKGTKVPSNEFTYTAPQNVNAWVSFVPTSNWEDSTLLLEVKVQDLNTGCDTTIWRQIYIGFTPIPKFSYDETCDGEPVLFTNNSTIEKGILRYRWDFDDGRSASVGSPSHTYDKTGTYNVKVTVISPYGIEADTTMIVVVNEVPKTDFTVQSACEGDSVKFTNKTPSLGGPITYSWDFGDGERSARKDPRHVYRENETFIVYLTADYKGCTATKKRSATQFVSPSASFDFSGRCRTDSFSFINESTIDDKDDPIGAVWRMGDGNIVTKRSPRYLFKSPGKFNVTLVAISRFGCRDSVAKEVFAVPSPVANFTFDKACDADPVRFTNKSSEPNGLDVTYNWDFGDNSTSQLFSPIHRFPRNGQYMVRLTATSDNSCDNVYSQELNVRPQVVADFEVRDACSGQEVQFVNKTTVSQGNVFFTWYFGDGDSSTLLNPSHVYNSQSTITYTVTLKGTTTGGCPGERNRPVTVEEGPRCKFTATQSSTDRTVWNFSPEEKGYDDDAYTWYFDGGGLVEGIKEPTFDFIYPESYYRIRFRIKTDAGCQCMDSSQLIFTGWTTSAKSIENIGVKVMPNPSSGSFSISSESSLDQADLVDVAGKVVATYEDFVQIDNQNLKAEFDHLSPGIYYLRLENSYGSGMTKLIIR